MREIRSWFGFDAHQLVKLVNERRLVVWGGNSACVEVLAFLQGCCRIEVGDVLCMQSVGFAEFKSFLWHYPPEFLKLGSFDLERHFVIIASTHYRKQILERLEHDGLIRGRDYIFAHELFRRKVVVRLFSKEILDIPAIQVAINTHASILAGCTFEVVGLPDPCVHDGLKELIDFLARIGPVMVTSFVARPELIGLVHSEKIRLRLVHFLDPELFFQQFPDGQYSKAPDWLVLLELVDRDVPVEWVQIGEEGQYKFLSVNHPNVMSTRELSYPVDFSRLLDALEQNDVKTLEEQQHLCSFDLAEAVKKAKLQKDKSCMCERVFPVFNANATMAVCHLYSQGLLCAEPATVRFADIEDNRRWNSDCFRCQEHGLHRLDLNLL